VADSPRRTISCKCGSVKVELLGSPMLVNICHCVGCQRGSAQIESLPGASRLLDAYGGTPYVLWRKDRVRLLQGRERLRDLRREGDKDTRRVVASCCNSPVLLDFGPGHWVSIYQQRFDEPVPQARARIQTRSMQPGNPPNDGLPLHPGYPFGMMVKLLTTRIAMGIGKMRSDL